MSSPESIEKLERLRRLLAQRAAASPALPVSPAPPAPAAPPVELELSRGQQGLWHLYRLAPESWAYNVVLALRIPGPLDIEALHRALARLARRHGSLRSRFRRGPQGVRQGVEEGSGPELELVDVTASDASDSPDTPEKEDTFAARLEAYAQRPFRLEEEPALRWALFRRGQDEKVLIWVFHHIVVDFWSIGLLLTELDRLLREPAAGDDLLPPAAASYGDFVAWQSQLLAAPEGEDLRRFWQRELAGSKPFLDLPLDRPRPLVSSSRGGTCPWRLDEAATEALRQLAAAHQATLFTTLLASVFVLLARLTGQGDLQVVTPVAGRSRPEFETVVGYFVNLLPLRARLERRQSLSDFLQQVAARAFEALDHADLPFAEMVERFGEARQGGRSPWADVGFALESRRMDRLGIVPLLLGEAGARTEIGGLICEAVPLRQQEGQCDLNLHLLEVGEGLAGLAHFDRDLLDATTVERWLGHWHTLLTAGARAPATPLEDLPYLAPAQRRQLLEEWGAGPDPAADWVPVVELLLRRAREAPQSTAVESDDETLTYGELDRLSTAWAAAMTERGAGRDQIVALLLATSPKLVVAQVAVFKAGAAFLPVDPALPDERRQTLLADSGARLALASREEAQQVAASGFPVLALEDLPGFSNSAAGTVEDGAAWRTAPTDPDQLAYVLYTSGSTGRPKGVAISHRGLPPMLDWYRRTLGLGPGDRVPCTMAASFDPSVMEVWSALTAGATMVFPDADSRLSGRAFGRWLVRKGITVSSSPPTLADDFLAEPPPPGLVLRSYSRGGDRMRSRPRPGTPFRVFNLYGPTEATVTVAGGEVAAAVPGSAPGTALPDLGWLTDGSSCVILDSGFKPVPPGALGEAYLGGTGLARCYWRQPALTAATFVPDPFSGQPGSRLYRTGDSMRWTANGRLDFVGRRDHQVKIRGVRIELGEVEAALTALPEVAAAAVLDQELGAAGLCLVAYVVGRSGPVEPQAVLEALDQRLPATMVPAAVVALDELPLSVNGKLDRRALVRLGAAQLEAARLELSSSAGEGHQVGYGSPLEQRIAALWSEVLGRGSVPLETSFFELGGHSLLLGRLQIRLEDELDRSLTVVELLRYPTVRSLARHLEGPKISPTLAAAAPLAKIDAVVPRECWHEPIAIIGMSGRFPGARNVDELWQLLRSGQEGLRSLSAEDLDAAGVDAQLRQRPGFVAVAGDVADVELFDADFFGFGPRDAEILDPQHRLFLECAWEALEEAGSVPGSATDRTGVFAGVARSLYLEQNLRPRQELVAAVGDYALSVANGKDFLATRVSYRLGLRGPSVNVQTACSTSLTAIHQACQSLRLGECDQALAGGVALHLPQGAGYTYEPGMILSPDGHCRSFDADAGGTVGANGVGVVLLKPLSLAQADGDPIHALILGSAINNDGALKAGYTAPSVDGQKAVLNAAYRAAGVLPATVGYVEAHGTATALGDPIEVTALTEVFAPQAGVPVALGSVLLGSIKSNLGHLDTAAGVAGLIKAALVVKHGEVPPSLHYQSPNPQIDFAAGPFQVARELQPLPAFSAPRRAAVSSFGIGGTNVHVVLQEAPAPSPAPSVAAELLPLSARSEAALEQARIALAGACEGRPREALAGFARTLQTGRRAFEMRGFAVVGEAEAAAPVLAARERFLLGPGGAQSAPAVAFLFPGQGAQHPGMVAGLRRRFPAFRRTLERCTEILHPLLGLDLLPLLERRQAPEQAANDQLNLGQLDLNQTGLAQPALFAVEISLAHLWLELGVEPVALLGHSIGEYVAACLADVFSLEDGLRLVAARGRLIQALPPGSMLSVDLPAAEVATLLPALLPAEVELAAVNTSRVSVVSGPAEALAALAGQLAELGIPHRPLHTSHAFHSSMMEPALEEFRQVVAAVSLAPPRRPVLSNVTGTFLQAEEAVDPGYWTRHLRSPVLFAQGLRTLAGEQPPTVLEVGPGTSLATLARGEVTGLRAISSLGHPRQARLPEEALLEAAGRLWTTGQELSWEVLGEGRSCSRVALPTYPFERRRFWVEAPAKSSARSSQEVRREPLEHWFYRPAWATARVARQEPPASFAGPWWVLADDRGLGDALIEHLRSEGKRVSAAAPTREQLVAAADEGAEPRIVYLKSYGAGLEEGGEALLRRSYHDLAAVAGAAAASGRKVRLDVVTSQAFAVLAGDLLLPAQAAAVGPVRVYPQENAPAPSRLIDLPPPGSADPVAVLQDLLAELAADAAGLYAWRRGQRWQQSFVPVTLPSSPLPGPGRRQPVVVLTGGLGGVALELAAQLVAQLVAQAATQAAEGGRPRLALLSRQAQRSDQGGPEKGLPESTRMALDGLRQAGAEILLVAADVTDRDSLSRALEEVRGRFGAVHGLIHAAGLPGGSLLQTEDAQAAAAVLAAKVEGTATLLELLPPERLDFCLLCSSLSSVLGGPGQAVYAAANAVLEAFAEAAPEGTVTAVAWDRWAGVGMAAGPTPRGMGGAAAAAMTAAEGRQVFARALGCGLPRLAVSVLPLEQRQRTPGLGAESELAEQTLATSIPAGPGTLAGSGSLAVHGRPPLATAYEAPRNATEETLAAAWAELLGIGTVGVHDDFFELGGHSLLGIRVLARIAESFQVELPLSALFERPTVAGLAAEVDRQRPAASANPKTASPPEANQAGEGAERDLEALDEESLAVLLESLEGARAS